MTRLCVDCAVGTCRHHTITHGTRSGYVRGCRDECCRRAEREYRRQYRRKTARS